MDTDKLASIILEELRSDKPDYDKISTLMSDPEELQKGEIWMYLNYLVIGYATDVDVKERDMRALIRFTHLAATICTNLTAELINVYNKDEELKNVKFFN